MKKPLIIMILFLTVSLTGCLELSTTGVTTTQYITELTTTDSLITTTEVSSLTTTLSELTSITETTEIQSCEVQDIDDCNYKLAEAIPDGSFTILSTYEDLSDSQAILAENDNPNLVILGINDKVVDMKYGAVNFRTKSISETTTLGHVGSRNPTYLNGSYNVDGVFLYAEGVFVYGMIAGVRFEVLNSEIELIPDIHLHNAYSYYQVVSGELVHNIAYFLRTADFQSIGTIDIAPIYLESQIRYFSYDGHYFYTDFRIMTDDLNEGVFTHAVNADAPYYNYYQYLSFRTKSNYTAEELNQYIAANTGTSSALYDTGDDFISAQDNVYINAAMELAFAIHESGWGNSLIAKAKNNLFGINAVDSDPYNSATTFDTVQDCIEYHVQYFLGTRYFNPQYYVSYGTNFGNKYQGMNYKYASDAFWGRRLPNITIIWIKP